MPLNRIKHAILRLSPEEKVVGIGSILTLIGAFMPWYSVTFSYDQKNIVETGFSGDLGVIGFTVFMLVALATLVLVGEHMNFRLPTFGYAKEKITLFLMGESAFLLLMTVAIYTKRSLDFTSAELRFGLYLALVGSFLGAFAAYALIQKLNRKGVQEFFGQDELEEAVAMKEDVEEKDKAEDEAPAPRRRATQVQMEELMPQEMVAEMEEEPVAEMPEESAVEMTPEPIPAPAPMPAPKPELKLTSAQIRQGNFFTREAGVAKRPPEPPRVTFSKPMEKKLVESEAPKPVMAATPAPLVHEPAPYTPPPVAPSVHEAPAPSPTMSSNDLPPVTMDFYQD